MEGYKCLYSTKEPINSKDGQKIRPFGLGQTCEIYPKNMNDRVPTATFAGTGWCFATSSLQISDPDACSKLESHYWNNLEDSFVSEWNGRSTSSSKTFSMAGGLSHTLRLPSSLRIDLSIPLIRPPSSQASLSWNSARENLTSSIGSLFGLLVVGYKGKWWKMLIEPILQSWVW